jgi:hypothetical protein
MSETTVEPVLESVPGRSLLDGVEKLTAAVRALVEVNQQLCKKIESNETKLAALARFVGEQSADRPSFGVL